MGQQVQIHPFEAIDRRPVFALLRELPDLYPNAYTWLHKKLDDCLVQRASCSVATISSTIVGVTIETEKGSHRRKLSSICVDERWRGQGIGGLLLDGCLQRWLGYELDEVIVTVPTSQPRTAEFLVLQGDFQLFHVVGNRYGDGRSDAVFKWTPNYVQESSNSIHSS